jgi:hypothetical protein
MNSDENPCQDPAANIRGIQVSSGESWPYQYALLRNAPDRIYNFYQDRFNEVYASI